MKQLLV